MKAGLKSLIGADRPKVIAVVGQTRREVEAGMAHASGGNAGLPIRSWCAEDGVTARQVRRELRKLWPALMVVAWTGKRGHTALKLAPLTVPPFRVLVFNEAAGFFAAKPAPLLAHVRRRLRDYCRNRIASARGRIYSLLYRAGQSLRDLAKLVYSVALRSADRIWSATLDIAAALAQFTPQPKLKPGRIAGPAMPLPRAAGTTYTEVILQGRVWPKHRIQRAVMQSQADFVLFRHPDDNRDPHALIGHAFETDAFAAARQIAYTGWRAQVLNKHPFRRLQPGEAAQVFAPWSSQIAVRRDLLARLGVPNAATTGAALMLLFWKAALAGWPSFVIGGSEALPQEPAMPLEDREFATRLPSARPAFLARGNVAFSPAQARPFRGLPRILIVSPYLPFPLSHGGAVRIFNLCRALAPHFDFILACFREAGETVRYPELHEVFRQVYAVDIDEKDPDPAVPKQVAEYRNSAMQHLIATLCSGGEIDLVQLEYTQMAEYRKSAGQIPVLLVEHDITFTLYRQLNDPGAALWREFEGQALRAASAVWTMSAHDRALALEHGAPLAATAVVPNGVDLHRFQPQPRATSGPGILFVGSFRHLPNLLAFEALRQTVMPAIWREFPHCRLSVVAGPDHERAAQLARRMPLLAKDPRISIQGFVEDVRPAYRECDIVAIPLPVSAGTNIKLMEAMACGRAIVSTPVGCQGLELEDGREILIRGIESGFAECVLELLRDPRRRQSLAAQARQTAERRFGWDAIAEAARESLLSAARPPSRAASASESRESHKSADSASRSTFESEVRQ